MAVQIDTLLEVLISRTGNRFTIGDREVFVGFSNNMSHGRLRLYLYDAQQLSKPSVQFEISKCGIIELITRAGYILADESGPHSLKCGKWVW